MTVHIEAGGYSAVINPLRGANCISLRCEEYGAKILREPMDFENPDNPYLYGMPVLYPVNRISGGKFLFEGREYDFGVNEPSTNCHLHGKLHNAEFSVSEVKEDYVKCIYTGMLAGGMHKFSMEISYKISCGGLEQRTVIENLSAMNMPNFLGFHTTFNAPFLADGKKEDIRLFSEVEWEAERDENYLPTGKVLDADEITLAIRKGEFYPLEKKISRNYKAKKGSVIEFKDIKKGISLIYENDEKFGWRLLYNGEGDEYVCFEPMTCMANSANAPFRRELSGFDYIKPFEKKEYISKIYLKKTE